ncbi:hypothetical protein MTO96_039404 [Rhipicephalus appendiculatus]
MSVTCLVNRGPSSFVLKVSGAKIEHLREAMAAHSSLRNVDESAIIQIHNKTFDTFVNLDENTVLEDNSIIRIMDVTIIEEANMSESMTDLDVSFTATEMLNFSESVAPVGHFSFPQTPVDIRARLANVKKGDVPNNLRRRIVDWLWYELSSHTL